jgi:Bor protein
MPPEARVFGVKELTMYKYLMTLVSGALLSACSTMNFVNGPQMENTVDRAQWHHVALLSLIELSRPMNVTYNCANQQWDTVTVERTFFNALADLNWPYFSLYSPMSIIYECREPID